ncbi:hypothetical protein V495_00497, partial [Pseudogymnoascus sp. VKM F-4514 (FW-929)]
VIVEPIQSEGGDNHASPAFFRGLRELTAKHDVLFIVDEVQTGIGATGKFWAHEHWDLPTPPDMVTFSKKAQTAGYYYGNPALRPNKPYRQFNTWMGDPARAILFRGIIEEVKRLNLVEHTAKTGDYLYAGLEKLAAKYPGQFNNLRGKGQGTFIAFDSPQRDEFLKKAKTVGINIGGSGASAVRLRPMLIFDQGHADILLEALEKIVKIGNIHGDVIMVGWVPSTKCAYEIAQRQHDHHYHYTPAKMTELDDCDCDSYDNIIIRITSCIIEVYHVVRQTPLRKRQERDDDRNETTTTRRRQRDDDSSN